MNLVVSPTHRGAGVCNGGTQGPVLACERGGAWRRAFPPHPRLPLSEHMGMQAPVIPLILHGRSPRIPTSFEKDVGHSSDIRGPFHENALRFCADFCPPSPTFSLPCPLRTLTLPPRPSRWPSRRQTRMRRSGPWMSPQSSCTRPSSCATCLVTTVSHPAWGPSRRNVEMGG